MKNEDKIKLFDQLMAQIVDSHEDVKSIPKNIGTLNKATGIQGFKVAEVGTPVFDSGDRYFIMLESMDGKRNVELSYYKESLKLVIDFI